VIVKGDCVPVQPLAAGKMVIVEEIGFGCSICLQVKAGQIS